MRKGWGKRRERGVMNKLEQQYAGMLEARRLAGEILWYGFECIKFKLTDNTYHEPDFLVQLADFELQVHEVKGGFFPEHNKLKSKMVAATIPLRYILCQYKNKATGWTFTEL